MSRDDGRSTHDEEPERVVIRDNRKIDPKTGEARRRDAGAADAGTPDAGAATSAAPATEPDEGPVVAAALLDERTADLQRLQAEYANYRRRAERDRLAAGEHAVGGVLAEFLPVLDDLDRAATHGDLDGGPLKAIADKLQATVDKLGLEAFGAVGDHFDPSLHEAVLHDESDEVSEPTCTTVMRKGYRYKDRLLRPAMVGVTDPAHPVAATEADGTQPAAQDAAAMDAGETPAEPAGHDTQP